VNPASKRLRRRPIPAALVLIFAAGAAGAQTDYLWPDFAFSAGAYLLSTSDQIGVEGEIEALGRPVDLEADLGLPDDETLLSARFDWAFAERHSVGLSYYSNEREGAREIDTAIEIGGRVFPVGARVEASLETTSIEGHYDWWFLRHDGFGVAGSLGLVYLSLDATATASVRIGGGSGTITRSESADTDLPVPMIGVALKGRPWSRLVLRGHARILPSVRIGDYEGEAASYGAGADFYFWGPLGVGLAYEATTYQVDIDADSWRGSVDLDAEGWRLYLRAAF